MTTKKLTTTNNELTQRQDSIVSEEVIEKFLFGSKTNLTKEEKILFGQIAVRANLDPFKREVYAIKYKDSLSIITGYEVYLKRAERTGLLDGWETSFKGKLKVIQIKKKMYDKFKRQWIEKTIDVKREDPEFYCQIIIYRKDRKFPLKLDVYLDEYTQDNPMWNSKTKTMLRKVAISTGFRLAFPDELGGLPYTADELPDNMNGNLGGTIVHNAEPETTPAETKAAKPKAKAKTKEKKIEPTVKPAVKPKGKIEEATVVELEYEQPYVDPSTEIDKDVNKDTGEMGIPIQDMASKVKEVIMAILKTPEEIKKFAMIKKFNHGAPDQEIIVRGYFNNLSKLKEDLFSFQGTNKIESVPTNVNELF